jgi:hypothetical protein
MKKIASVLSLIAAVCVLTSCANNTNGQPASAAPASQPAPAAHHHVDYKGESNK